MKVREVPKITALKTRKERSDDSLRASFGRGVGNILDRSEDRTIAAFVILAVTDEGAWMASRASSGSFAELALAGAVDEWKHGLFEDIGDDDDD